MKLLPSCRPGSFPPRISLAYLASLAVQFPCLPPTSTPTRYPPTRHPTARPSTCTPTESPSPAHQVHRRVSPTENRATDRPAAASIGSSAKTEFAAARVT